VEAGARACRARRHSRSAGPSAATQVAVRVLASIDGAAWVGLACDWGLPGPGGAEAALSAARAAGAAFSDHVGCTPFAIWRDVHGALAGAGPEDGPERAARAFGVALVERALLDAACRAAAVSLRAALRADLFGFQPWTVHPELRGWDAAASLPAAPPARVRARHAVHLSDALRAADVPAAERIDDGLPGSLEGWIERGGLTSFEIELGGDPRADARRLFDVAALLAGRPVEEVVLDARGAYADPAELARVLDALATTPDGEALCARLLCIKDPLPRARVLDPALTPQLRAFPLPVVLDAPEAGGRGFEQGYLGLAARSAHGVFHTLLARGLCAARGGFQLFCDRAAVPLLPLHQDLALAAVLGCEHAERGGHRRFRGLEHLGELERAVALAHHPELYAAGGDGVFLHIEGGALDVSHVDSEPGFASAAAHAAER
jgi:hypothetical protein